MNFDTHQFAWAAGFFDGEGHMQTRYAVRKKIISGRRVYSGLHIEIAQKDRRVLDRFKEIMGVGYILGPYRNNRNQDHYSYRYMACKFEHAQHVVACMWKWLSPIKREQCRSVIVNYLSRPRLKTGRIAGTHCSRGHEFTPENTRTYLNKRYCKTCSHVHSLARSAKRKGVQFP